MTDPLMNRTAYLVVVASTGQLDTLGNDITERDLQPVYPCAWHPASTSENTNAQQRTSDVVTFFGPVDFAGQATDRMVLDGVEYAITSAVQRWYDPILGYAECELTRVEG